MDNKPPEAFIVRVYGRVQGVGFRYSARQKAVQLKLTGWVRNEPDGSVALYFEGSSESCGLYLKWLERGPQGASVINLTKKTARPQGTYKYFTIEY